MSLIIRVTMPDGSEWDVPADAVAHERAKFYATRDVGTTSREEFLAHYKTEMEYALSHHDELTDWASNNMNWADVKAVATMHKGADAVDYQEGWTNGGKRVIEVP